MNTLKPILCLSLVFLIAGCESMSEAECLTANWFDRGYRDGVSGQPLTRIEDHRQACAKVNVIPNRVDYQKGHDQGIQEYCTPDRAIYEGRQGRAYRYACPAQLEGRFLYYYEAGRRVYDVEQEVSRLNSQSSSLERQLRKEKDSKKRNHLRDQLRQLDNDLRRARDRASQEAYQIQRFNQYPAAYRRY